MRFFLLLLLSACVGASANANTNASHSSDPFNSGLFFDQFDLTLAPGHRTEALGPLFYSEQKEDQHTWAVPPLFSRAHDPVTDWEEIDFAYPFISYDRFGDQYRFHIFQVFNFSGGETQRENYRDRFTLFPIYFQQRSSDPSENYTAVFPFYGRLKNRLFREEIFFIMFPIYGTSRKKGVVTENYFYPFYHQRHGQGVSGWQLFPFYGVEHKEVTTRTNGFNEVEIIGGHERKLVLWPFFLQQTNGIGTANPNRVQASLPAYSIERSPQRDVTTVLWPFFSKIDDRQRKYQEWQMPWPLIIKARGEGKNTTRVFPFYSHAQSATLQSDFVMWPIYKYNRFHSDPVDRERTRILFFLYSDTILKDTESGAYNRRVDFWPFYTHRRDLSGNSRLQVLSVLEPLIPNNKSIERNYSHVWSVWRAEKNVKTGAASQSLLWNLYRNERAPEARKCSLLFGLFQYQSGASGKQLRLFYIPMGKAE